MKMKQFFSIVICLFSFGLKAQKDSNRLILKDSTIELRLMNSITATNLAALKICSNVWNCKGFVTESDSLLANSEQMNIRAILTPLSDFKFKIEYNWKSFDPFIVDTFFIFCLNNVLCFASKAEIVNQENAIDLLNYMDFIPSSSDDREVVFVTSREEKIIFYTK